MLKVSVLSGMAVVFSFTLVLAGDPATARAVLEKAVTAHGGKQNLLKLKKVQVTYTMKGDFLEGLPGVPEKISNMDLQVEETLDIPRRVKKTISGKMNVDGKGLRLNIAWAVEAGKEKNWYWEDGKLIWLRSGAHSNEEAVQNMQRTYSALESLAEIKQEKPKLSSDKSDSLVGIQATENQGAVSYFDAKTGLFAKAINSNFALPGASKAFRTEGRVDDYKDVDGAKLFMKMDLYYDQKKLLEIVVKNVKFFEAFEDRDFAPPK